MQQRQGPQQSLGFLANLGTSLAGVGGTTDVSGTGSTTGTSLSSGGTTSGGTTAGTTNTIGATDITKTMSPVEQAQGWSKVFSNLLTPFSKGGLSFPSIG
jgi:hypothetical protein